MKRVLMVCLGNICRSPLAEGILRSKINPEKVLVESAGTGGWHVGELPDPRSIEVAQDHHLDITNQRCRKFTYADFQEYDLIYVMDRSNLNDVLSLTKNEQDAQKVQMILNEIHPGQNLDVPDPYYGGDRGFENVFQMLEEACDIIANKIQKS